MRGRSRAAVAGLLDDSRAPENGRSDGARGDVLDTVLLYRLAEARQHLGTR